MFSICGEMSETFATHSANPFAKLRAATTVMYVAVWSIYGTDYGMLTGASLPAFSRSIASTAFCCATRDVPCVPRVFAVSILSCVHDQAAVEPSSRAKARCEMTRRYGVVLLAMTSPPRQSGNFACGSPCVALRLAAHVGLYLYIYICIYIA